MESQGDGRGFCVELGNIDECSSLWLLTPSVPGLVPFVMEVPKEREDASFALLALELSSQAGFSLAFVCSVAVWSLILYLGFTDIGLLCP